MNDLFKNPFGYLIDTFIKYSGVYYIPVIIIGILYYRFDNFPVYESEKLISLVLLFTCFRFLIENWENLNKERRVQCLVVGLIIQVIVIVSLWEIFYPFYTATENDIFRNLVLILLGVPYALFILHWHDMNKKEDIKNAGEANRLTDFHKIQEWASTKEESELKVAAIFQLRPYIIGKYGAVFQRPSIELFRSLLASWKPVIKPETKRKFSKSNHFPEREEIIIPHSIAAIHSIIREEGNRISKNHLSHFNLQYADLSNCDLRNSNLMGTNFNHSSMTLANLTGSSFSSLGFDKAFFDRTKLSSTIWINGRRCREDLVGAPQSSDDFTQGEGRK